MKSIHLIVITLLLLLMAILGQSCQDMIGQEEGIIETPMSMKTDDPNVAIRELSEPMGLNPISSRGASARYIKSHIFPAMVARDPISLKKVPFLAKKLPTVEEIINKDGLRISFEIRKEAQWDNGQPITAEDVLLAFKLVKAPGLKNEHYASYFKCIEAIEIDEFNPRKYTVITNQKYMLAEEAASISPLPSYIWDPDSVMYKFTLRQLNLSPKLVAADKEYKKFQAKFLSDPCQRDTAYIVGAGPYRLEKWETNKKIVLKRKENWWGDKLKGINTYFNANSPQLTYKIINDETTAIVALKNEKIDIMRGINYREFIELPNSKKFRTRYNTYTPDALMYEYVGLNCKNPIFSDKKVRQAMAYIVDVDGLIENITYGMAERVNSGAHPTLPNYNDSIPAYPFDIEKAQQMLAEAGWSDTNGNGILDKEIGGEVKEMSFDFLYNSGNQRREAIALIFQEAARQVGVEVNIIVQEAAVFLENLRKHNFDVYVSAWGLSMEREDPGQLWHTDAHNGGSNHVGFGNKESDAIIEAMQKAIADSTYIKLSKRLQVLQHEEAAYLFLFAPKERIAIHKRFKAVQTSVFRPGYYAPGFLVEMN